MRHNLSSLGRSRQNLQAFILIIRQEAPCSEREFMEHISAKWEKFGCSPALLSPWPTRAIPTAQIKLLRPFYYFVGFAFWKCHESQVFRSPWGLLILPWMHCLHGFHKVWHHGAARARSENIKVSLILLPVPFLITLQSMSFTASPKQQKKGRGSAFVLFPKCLVWRCSSYKNTMGKGRKIHTKCGSSLPLLLLFHPKEVMLMVHNKARFQWANLIFHTCLFICWKCSLCRSVDSLETDVTTGL